MAGNLPGDVVAASTTAALRELAVVIGKDFACLEGLTGNQLMFLPRPGHQYNWAVDLDSAKTRLSEAAGRFAALQEGKPEDYIREALTSAGQPANLIQRVEELVHRAELIPSFYSNMYEAQRALNAIVDRELANNPRIEWPALTPRGKARQALQAGLAGLRAAESTLDVESTGGRLRAQYWNDAFGWMTREPPRGLDWAVDLVDELDNLKEATLAQIRFNSLAEEAACRCVSYEHFIKKSATEAVSKRAALALRVKAMLTQLQVEMLGKGVPYELKPGWPRVLAIFSRELFASSAAAANPELVTALQAELGALKQLTRAVIDSANQALDARRRGLPDNLEDSRASAAALRDPLMKRIQDLLHQLQERSNLQGP